MSEAQWYMAVGGQQVGPVNEQDVVNAIKSGSADGTTLVFTTGMDNWTPLRQVDRFRSHLPASAPPPVPAASGRPSGPRAHEIDYEIVGEDLQFVVVELDPNESVVAEAGALMYMTQGIQMETIFGDGSGTQAKGLMGALLGAGKRILTGESLFMTVFTAQGGRKEKVAFAAPFPGRILAMDLKQLGGELICQKDSFLCAAKGISIGIAFQKKIGVALFGGEGFIMQRLTGDGIALVHAGGTVMKRELSVGETLRVDTCCIVALTPSVHYDIQFTGGFKNSLFGGEGLFLATVTGPGTVWLQSLPFSRLAGRVLANSTGRGKDEGGVLGNLGGLLGNSD
jgi:uncharacterized protein (TIGR00266 family)